MFVVICLLLSLASAMNFQLGSADEQRAYFHRGPISRDLYVRPPLQIGYERGMILKLKKLPYGI